MSHKLILRDLSFSYGAESVLTHFSAEFTPGRPYAIVGRSGIGKTTLLRMIAGLDKDYRGEILGGGIENVSFAFQEHRLFPELSALENAVIANGNMKNDSLVNEAKEILFSLGFIEHDFSLLPSELSGGMKQRVALARAFLRKTPILLLDEPTKELDETIRESLYNLILKESKIRLILIVSHHAEDLVRLNAVEIKI